MTEFLRRLREKVEAEIATVRQYEGPEAVAVRASLRVLQIAEEVQEELEGAWLLTADAAEVTGWSVDTLQAHAKTMLEGGELPDTWAGLIVERGPDGYRFALGSIPEKLSRAS